MIYWRELTIIIKKMFYADLQKTIAKKWKQSLLAILIALLFSSVLILIKGQNPLWVFYDIIQGATLNAASMRKTLVYFSMFAVAGTAIIIGFKSGLFNIGISGQMLISGTSMMILAIQYQLPWVLLLIIGMAIGGGCAAIAGALKSLFNIHEVVSTILLNWIFFYISQYLLGSGMPWMDDVGTTKHVVASSRIMVGTSVVLPSLLISLMIIGGIIILFKKTKWGFALQAVGQNVDASKYAGIKITSQMMLGMGLSGMAAGALAAINYLGKFGSMSHSVGHSLPTIGFQGISVALIAFNSLYGLIPAAIFWAVITSGIDYASIVNPEVPKEILSLMNGLIIYAIAISIIFIRFRPLKIMSIWIIKINSAEIKNEQRKLKISKHKQRELYQQKTNYLQQNARAEDARTLHQMRKLKVSKAALWHQFRTVRWNYWRNHWHIYVKNIFKSQLKNNVHLGLSLKLKNIFSKIDALEQQINNLNDHLTKQVIKINHQNMHDGLRILNRETKRRIDKLQATIVANFWYSKLLKTYLVNKEKSQNFSSQYSLIKLDFKQATQKLNKIKNKHQRHKEIMTLKAKFHQAVLLLEKKRGKN